MYSTNELSWFLLFSQTAYFRLHRLSILFDSYNTFRSRFRQSYQEKKLPELAHELHYFSSCLNCIKNANHKHKHPRLEYNRKSPFLKKRALHIVLRLPTLNPDTPFEVQRFRNTRDRLTPVRKTVHYRKCR